MKKNKKGFTLAELLIVVAIIAVLVAISIPVFSAKLESSREATDLANLRAAYARATTDYLTGEYSSVQKATGYGTQIKQVNAGWLGDNQSAEIGGISVTTNDALKSVTNKSKVWISVTVQNDTQTVTFSTKDTNPWGTAAGGGGG